MITKNNPMNLFAGSKAIIHLLIFLLISSCEAQSNPNGKVVSQEKIKSSNLIKLEEFVKNHPDNGESSQSLGMVSNGSLKNGKLMPFSGKNFQYFDTSSYTMGRAFVHSKVREIVLLTYEAMEKETPDHRYFLMETSNEKGGKLDPHHTHQNGLSIDFMTPLLKNGKEYNGLDTMGVTHYFMEFDDNGYYKKDTSVTINFDIIALHLLQLNKEAQKQGMKIEKVIFKLELKDELFACKYGDMLKQSGIYFAQRLTPMVNSVHDDHYHVDFGFIK